MRSVSKETGGIILRKELRAWVGADGDLGLTGVEEDSFGPSKRKRHPYASPSQKVFGQSLGVEPHKGIEEKYFQHIRLGTEYLTW